MRSGSYATESELRCELVRFWYWCKLSKRVGLQGIMVICEDWICLRDGISIGRSSYFGVRWYLGFKPSTRDVVQTMAERGIVWTHTTILRWYSAMYRS